MKMNTPTREQAKFHRRVQAAMARAYAPGREERMAAAQAKRDRKAEKRARDAQATVVGQMNARERLEGRPWL
jgi:tryptophan 2,3-dioxygenase